MSSYKRYLIIFIFLSSLFAKEVDKDFNEDLYIVYALEYERQGNTNQARFLYEKLYDNTNNYEYYIRYLRASLATGHFKDIVKKVQNHLGDNVKEQELILRIYCVSLLNLNQTDKALEVAQKLLTKYKSALNYEVLANVYFVKKDYTKAASYFETSYSMNNSSNTLLNLVNILYAYLNKKPEALAYLETHVRLFGCDSTICSKLISIYQEQNNVDGIISVLKRSYQTYKNEDNEDMANKTYKVLIAYLEKKDINEAISFLEKEKVDDVKLVSLYKRTDQPLKALKLVRKLYKQDGNVDLLAQIAILEFETAADKKKVLNSVITKFNDVLTVLDSHVYQNYLGYILIDYDVDVKKGLIYVEQALEKAPNNIAYIDSKAWGNYKLENCKIAYKLMKKVVDEVGLSDSEIKLHWKKIKECSKK
ncbi:tetratricopeptide repeat protein [Arcobacter sp.]|uniref:tetratricopeptide repeat protein n=1 Tax=Arcobacter sp. TaxID=1872629 RepID=UPI003C787E8E